MDRTLYVRLDAGASDQNPGTANQPLRSIQEAVNRAQVNKNKGLSTRVLIAPGIYREAVSFAYSNYNGGGTDARVVVEGAGSDQTIISGADVYDHWQPSGSGVYSHSWTYTWGTVANPYPDHIREDIVLRREMVFVDGSPATQVLLAAEMRPGTFRIDEQSAKIYLYPPAGVTLQEALVEVSVRDRGWFSMWENNLTLRGFAVQHIATPWREGSGALVVSASNNALLEDISASYNNFAGLRIEKSSNVTLNRFTGNHNGSDGWSIWQCKNLVAENTETSYNNWRGYQGGYTDWSPGNKSFSVHGMTLRHHRAVGNYSRGLWLDTDHRNVLLEDVELRDNLLDGLFLEANQGPIVVRDALLVSNMRYGVVTANSEQVTFETSVLSDNGNGNFLISGMNEGREIADFETSGRFRVYARNWTIRGCAIGEVRGALQGGYNGEGRFLIGTTFGAQAWQRFTSTYQGSDNRWYTSERPDAFWWTGNEFVTLAEWQRRTGQDLGSTFQKPETSTISTERIAIRQGWNFIAGALQPGAADFGAVLKDILPVVKIVRDQSGNVFRPASGINTIGLWDHRQAYLLYANAADTLVVQGRKISPDGQTVALHPGWNWISYPYSKPLPVGEALASITESLVLVKDARGSLYYPKYEIDQIEMMNPGEGYMVFANRAIVLSYTASKPGPVAFP